MKTRKQKLAIFDIDGTIFRSSLVIEFVNESISAGLFPKEATRKMEKEYQAWLRRKGDYNAYIRKVVEVYFDYIEGLRKKDVDVVVKRMLRREREKVYRFTRDLVRKLKSKGDYHFIAISGSPIYAVKEFAEFMGFNTAFGTENVIENGIFKRQTKGKHFSKEALRKAPALIEYINRENLNVDWQKSIAVGDSEPDISILKMVGNPIAFNPSRGLARYARKHGWRIVVERKDVIYDIKDFKFISHFG